MSKNRDLKRRRKPHERRTPDRNGRVASAQTLWRAMHLDASVPEELVATTLRVQPSLWRRDAEAIEGIEQASDVQAVLDLAPTATGMANYAWLKRMCGFGARGADAIAERLTGGWLRSFPQAQAGI